MGYDSLRIELRYRHIWQTKWAAAATTEDSSTPAVNTVPGNTTSNSLSAPQQSSQRGRRSNSLNRNVHYETEPDPGVDSPMGNKPPPSSTATSSGQPANSATSGGSATRGRHKSYRHYK